MDFWLSMNFWYLDYVELEMASKTLPDQNLILDAW